MALSDTQRVVIEAGGSIVVPTQLGQSPALIPTGGRIRAGIKFLTRKAAAQPQAQAIYEQAVAAGQSFEQIERALAKALPGLKTRLATAHPATRMNATTSIMTTCGSSVMPSFVWEIASGMRSKTFAVCSILKCPVGDYARESLPFLIAVSAVTVLLNFVPEIALVLPNLIFGRE